MRYKNWKCWINMTRLTQMTDLTFFHFFLEFWRCNPLNEVICFLEFSSLFVTGATTYLPRDSTPGPESMVWVNFAYVTTSLGGMFVDWTFTKESCLVFLLLPPGVLSWSSETSVEAVEWGEATDCWAAWLAAVSMT